MPTCNVKLYLLSFSGTDTLVSLEWIDKYYGGPFVAGSVPATEHSVMCAGIATSAEREITETYFVEVVRDESGRIVSETEVVDG